MSKPIHWQHDVSPGFYCDLDPEKSYQSPGHECKFCRQAEREELEQLRQKVKLLEPPVLTKDSEIAFDLPDRITNDVIRIHHEMNDHIRGGDQTPSQTLIRLIGIGIEEWDRERRDD
jgi:hypothetical protein